MAAKVPDVIEGYAIGAELRTSGVLSVRGGTSRLDLPVQAYLAEAAALTGGFEADDFLAGVRRAAAVQHEALLPFVTGGRAGDYVFGIAKSVEGGTLAVAVAGNGAFSEARALALGMSVAGALAALERAGMRHGDLAPERILIVGLDSFVVEPPRLVPASLVPRAEKWQAPEEARGGENGVQSDQFVLGLLLWFALTGNHPVGSAPDVRRALRDWKTPDLTLPLRAVSPETRAVIARLLAPEPANRFPTATDALRALQDSASSRPETAPISLALPSVKALVDAPKRPPGRLFVETRIGEALLELADDVVFVGAGAGKSVRVQTETFPEAILRVERAPAADVVHQIAGDLTVNGKTAASQPLADGDRVVAPGLSARYEKSAKPAARTPGAAAAPAPPPPKNHVAGVVTAVAMIGTIAALGWGGFRVMGATKEASDTKAMAARAEQLRDEQKRVLVPADTPPVATDESPVAAELLARTAYENAARTARARPSEARTKYYEVWQRFPETAYGLLARLDALEIDRRTKAPADAALEDLLRAVDLREGELDDETVSKLRTYIEDHGGTLAAARAQIALVKSQWAQRGKFDADIATVRALCAKKDFPAALALIAKILDYAPPSLGDVARAERRAIEEAMGGPPRDGPPKKPGDGGPGPAPKNGSPQPDEAAERNRKAEELFQNGRKLMDGGKDVEALDAFLKFLRESKDTVNGTKHEMEVRARIGTLATGVAGVTRLFRGKVERPDKNAPNRWRITYDFEDAAQLEDFKDVLAFEQPPRASWKHEGGAVRCTTGSGAFVLNAPFGADEVSVSAKIMTDRPHDLGVMLMDPTEQRRFYLYTIGNTFFTLGLGADAKPFLENAIVLFGPDMWAKTPPGQLGFVRKCGIDEPKVLPSEPTPVKCGKSGEEVWMKFEGGRSIRGSAQGDKPYKFPGALPGFFVIRSSGWFDDLVVEGTLDVNWVTKRWREIVDAL